MEGNAMEENLERNKMLQALDWIYEKTLEGLPGTLSAEELAADYLSKNNYDPALASKKLVNWQVGKCGTSGFVTGLGGIITLPIAIPANISSVLYVQMRMIAAIAHMGGYDIKSDQVKSLVYMCLVGTGATDVAKDVGIQIGTKLSKTAIERLSSETIKRINQAVGFRLVTKFGQTGVINLGKAIPIVGGIINGGFDIASTKTIGKVSRNFFL